MITAEQFVAGARSLVGVPWLHQGRSRRGIDCIGLPKLAAESQGLDVDGFLGDLGVVDSRNYGRTPSGGLLATLERHCQKIEEPVTGCLILIQFPGEKMPRHFGIYTGKGTIIHANGKIGRVVEHGYRMSWVRWTHSFWLARGVDYGI